MRIDLRSDKMKRTIRTIVALLGALVAPWITASAWNRPGVNFWGDPTTMYIVLGTSVGSGLAFLALLPDQERIPAVAGMLYALITAFAICLYGLVRSFI
jgi:hypothetical protein